MGIHKEAIIELFMVIALFLAMKDLFVVASHNVYDDSLSLI